jgi:1-deoxy-D-xylulose-5-phosphate reductoisomerase
MAVKKIGIIGITGTIGQQALDVVLRNRNDFEVIFLTAHCNKAGLDEAAAKLSCTKTLLTSEDPDGLIPLIDDSRPDIVLVGAAGLDIINAVYHMAGMGITLALANKESIVSAGKLLTKRCAENGTKIIPVDSEHSAIFQCLCGHCKDQVERVILTASGGALRDRDVSEMPKVTLKEVLAHPNWNMGRKITVDSATMMNKGLELIEARILFDMPPEKLDTLIHPQSIVHSMVTYTDGSMLAQMGLPDMRTPIAYALGYPERLSSGVGALELAGMSLSFSKPDLQKYKCLSIALEVLRVDKQSLFIAMNTANDEAVAAFIQGKIPYIAIADVVETALNKADYSEPEDIQSVLEIEREIRSQTNDYIMGIK